MNKHSNSLFPGLFILFFLILLQNKTTGQSLFVKCIGSIRSDIGMACQPTSDKGTILLSETSTNGMDVHCGITKTDSNGTMQWTKLFIIGQWSVPQNIRQTKDEGYIVYGTATDSTFLNNNKHFLFLHMTNISGDRIWDKDFSLSDNDIAVNLVESKYGGFIASSIADYNISAYPKAAITRLDDDGNIIWSKRYSCNYGLILQKAIELPNGNICFTAYSGNFSASPFNDIIVTILNQNGDILWTKNFGSYYDDEPNAMATDSSNEIFITGRTYFINRDWDSFLLKLDSMGNILVSKFYDAGTSQGEIMRCIIARDNGTCTMLGDIGGFNERDISMLHVDANGSIVSGKLYPLSPTFTNYPYDFYTTHDGGFIFTGDVRLPSALRGAILVRTDPDGNAWCYSSPANFTEYNASFNDSVVYLSTIISPVNTRNDSATIPVNSFRSSTVCAMPTGIDDRETNDNFIINVFPNPASDFVTIETNPVNPIEHVTIYNFEGEKVTEIIFTKNEKMIIVPMAELSQGIYMLDCFSKTGSEKIKIIKY